MTDLQTFVLPECVTGNAADKALGHALIKAWQTDGISQIASTPDQELALQSALQASKRFFKMPHAVKASCLSDLSYSGYVFSGEEVTAGERDNPEIFTVCKDLPHTSEQVQQGWPCHGPAPWPDADYKSSMQNYMDELGLVGEKLLELVALGLELPDRNSLTSLTKNGWHHMRVLRFPAESSSTSRGIGAHTDYGLLVIASQDDVGGLYIRPPVAGEKRNRNWLQTESSAGQFEHQEPWTFVKPVPRVFTVFPGDILQFLTDGLLLSTPHKVKLNTRERFAFAYFHEPHFEAVARPVLGNERDTSIHYGEHFTNMFMRCYPERITTKRIHRENRLSHIERLKENVLSPQQQYPDSSV